MTRPAPIIAGIVAALFLLFGAYMGSYYAMLEGQAAPVPPPDILLAYPEMRLVFPSYRWDNTAVEAAFTPAHELDRLIRPGYWEPTPSLTATARS